MGVTFDEIPVECRFEERRVVADDGFVYDEFWLGRSHANGDGCKGLRSDVS